MLPRATLMAALAAAVRRSPITALLGPRQCGKTTLALEYAESQRATVLDLEDPNTLGALDNPYTLLSSLEGLVIIDEVQRRPELFPVLRVLADRKGQRARFLLLGSASPDLLRQSSESLAGRIAFVEMSGFDLTEVGPDDQDRLWLRGGFPRSFLAVDDVDSFAWREDFVRTFLERDLVQMGLSLPALLLRRFWTMVAHYHGQTWNSSEVAGALGVNDTTARRYLDVLAGSYMVRVLPPWFENVGKRQRRAPKVYLRDSGLMHTLLGLHGLTDILSHPKAGASWEGFALEQILRLVATRDAYYWAVHGGAELDLLVHRSGKRVGFEFKRADTPELTRSMQTAFDDLSLDRLWVIFPGERTYDLGKRITALPLGRAAEELG